MDMDFKVPKGVQWSAKYNTPGGRRFSTLGLGLSWNSSAQCGKEAMSLLGGTGLILQKPSDPDFETGLSRFRKDRAQSAPVRGPHTTFSGHGANSVAERTPYVLRGVDDKLGARSIRVRPVWHRGGLGPDTKVEDKEDGEEETEETDAEASRLSLLYGEGGHGQAKTTTATRQETPVGRASWESPHLNLNPEPNPNPKPKPKPNHAARADRPSVLADEPPFKDWSEKCIEWVTEITASGLNLASPPGHAHGPHFLGPTRSREWSARSRDWTTSGMTPLSGKTGIRPDLFANELWYKKGYRHLYSRRGQAELEAAGRPTRLSSEQQQLHLHCPTAASRARQVTSLSGSTGDAGGAARREAGAVLGSSPPGAGQRPDRRRSAGGKYEVPPDRFKGTRTVTAEELRSIVERLSTCDPTRVPDSGCSRNMPVGKMRQHSWQNLRAAVGLP